MAATLLTLAERMESLASAVSEGFAAPANETAWAIISRLTLDTPVDTSKALSNWQIGLGRPFMFELPAFVPGHYGSTEAASREHTLANARYLLSHRKPGQAVYISNNAPYIRKLNDGYSRQAAAGFVERAVAAGRKVAANARVLSQSQSARFKPRKFKGDPVT